MTSRDRASAVAWGQQLIDGLQGGRLDPAFIETADVGCVILALLERIHRLEEVQLGQRQGE